MGIQYTESIFKGYFPHVVIQQKVEKHKGKLEIAFVLIMIEQLLHYNKIKKASIYCIEESAFESGVVVPNRDKLFTQKF